MGDRARGGGTEILVVGGKGGVGKTSVSAMLAKLLVGRCESLLVIDADPVVSLTYALGERPGKTVGEFREDMIEEPGERRRVQSRPIKTAIRELVTRSRRGYDLLVLGRAEGRGCFCGINELLRFGVQALSSEYEVTLIDCEAGIEQLNRRAVHRIDRLLLVSDTSRRGLETVVQLRDLAVRYNDGEPLRAGAVLNRVRDAEEADRVSGVARTMGLEVIGWVPEDPQILDFNAQGRPLVELPDASDSLAALQRILETALET